MILHNTLVHTYTKRVNRARCDWTDSFCTFQSQVQVYTGSWKFCFSGLLSSRLLLMYHITDTWKEDSHSS